MNADDIAAIRDRIKHGGNEYALTRMAYDLVVVLDALEQAGFSTSLEQGRYEQVGVTGGHHAGTPHRWHDACVEAGCVPVFRRVDGEAQ